MLKDQMKKIEQCGCSSYVWGLRSLLNTRRDSDFANVSFDINIISEVLLLLDDVGCCCLLSIIVKYLSSAFGCFCTDVAVSDGTGGWISMVWNSFFHGPVGFTYVFSCACVGWAFPVVDCVSFLSIWNGSFGCISTDLMVLVPLKKTLTLYVARVCLTCSLRPLMYGMTTLAPSINFSVDGFGFCWFSVEVCLVENCSG